MWEKVKDKEREHTSSPAWVNSPNPTGESSSTSWKSSPSEIPAGWVCLVPVTLHGPSVFPPQLSPSLGAKPPLALNCRDWCELVTKGGAVAGTCGCHLPVLLCHIHQSWQCLCNGLGCEFRLCVIVSESTWLVNAIDADARIHSKCCVSCFAFIFKYIWVGFSLF